MKRKTLLATIAVWTIIMTVSAYIMGSYVTAINTVRSYEASLSEIQNILRELVDVLKDLQKLNLEQRSGFTGTLTIHMYVYVNGYLISYHTATNTIIGLNWLENKTHGRLNWQYNATYISLTDSAESPSNSWTQLPDEHASGGLIRADASSGYGHIGTGNWWLNHTFTATTAINATGGGVNWRSSGDGNLLCAEKWTTQATLNTDDELTVACEFTFT